LAEDALDLDPFGTFVFGDEQVHGSSKNLLRGVSEQVFCRRVPAGDEAVRCCGDDGVVGGLHQRTEAGVG
jgi:hypothetical protein